MSHSSSKIWLITGANSGLGFALAEYALSKGDKVIAAARNISKIPASLKEASHLRIDLDSSEAELKEAVQAALKVYGKIEVLVNNAGYGSNAVVEELSFVSSSIHIYIPLLKYFTVEQTCVVNFKFMCSELSPSFKHFSPRLEPKGLVKSST